jgi:hypothetical protein
LKIVELLRRLFFLVPLKGQDSIIDDEKFGNVVDSMENVKWINGSHKEDNRIFDSEFEVKEWIEALYPDFVAYLNDKTNVGYATPDEKVNKYLVSLFPKWAAYINTQIDVRTEKTEIKGQIIYKIWTVKV